MYFDFEDYHPDIAPVGRALTRLEVVLLTIIFHLLLVIVLLVSPKWFPWLFAPPPAQVLALQQPQQQPTFVFVQPRNDLKAPRPPNRGEASDQNRMARAPERAPKPENEMPKMRGNTAERVERNVNQPPRGQGPAPDPAAGQPQARKDPQADSQPLQGLDSSSAPPLPNARTSSQNGANGRSATAGGQLGDALRNLQRYVQRDGFDNQQGGGGEFGPEIQFDTKGVEFGPWIRRFIAQVKRNWFIPYAAMSMKGHVIVTFNVHKDGSITDLTVVGPCPVDAFNNAAFGALVGSNPTQPLPPEYPSEKAFFTVTFFYNETPR
ncbi:MAG TPA: TonB family protein [Vicinamibacterales bacterium]|jgi:TonB family protein|nr:TonB family protein [Vicinamibacterales bacterium]